MTIPAFRSAHGETQSKKVAAAKVSDWPGFPLFWQSYPRRVAKALALRTWNRLRLTEAEQQQMYDALVWQVEQDGWKEGGGKFIPHPSTYLNHGRWQDERPVTLRSDNYGHIPPCANWQACRERVLRDAREGSA